MWRSWDPHSWGLGAVSSLLHPGSRNWWEISLLLLHVRLALLSLPSSHKSFLLQFSSFSWLQGPAVNVMERQPITRVHPTRNNLTHPWWWKNSLGKEGRRGGGRGLVGWLGWKDRCFWCLSSLPHLPRRDNPKHSAFWHSPWQCVCCSVSTTGPEPETRPHDSERTPAVLICFLIIPNIFLMYRLQRPKIHLREPYSCHGKLYHPLFIGPTGHFVASNFICRSDLYSFNTIWWF